MLLNTFKTIYFSNMPNMATFPSVIQLAEHQPDGPHPRATAPGYIRSSLPPSEFEWWDHSY